MLFFVSVVSVFNGQSVLITEQKNLCTDLSQKLSNDLFVNVPQKTAAKAIYVFDFTKKLPVYSMNSNQPLALASLSKLMTTRIALRNDNTSDVYQIQKDDIIGQGSIGMKVGEKYRIIDLVNASLIASSNDAVTALAKSTRVSIDTFPQVMNFEAMNLGLKTMYFSNPTGLDDDEHLIAKNLGSAHDILMLLYADYMDYPSIYPSSTYSSYTMMPVDSKNLVVLKNTNTAIDKLPILIASKTGYTTTAGGNLAILWREPKGDLLGAVVMGSTEEGRFSDMILVHNDATMYANLASSMPDFCK